MADVNTPDRPAPAREGLRRFARFFDDAAIFPPGLASLRIAVRRHIGRRGTPLGGLVGPLLLTPDKVASAAEFARQEIDASGFDGHAEPLRIGLIVGPDSFAGATEMAAKPPDGVVISGLEVTTDARWREQLAVAACIADAATYTVHVELSADAVSEGGISGLRGTRARLKFRTGGLTAGLFPTVDRLAVVVHEAATTGVAFKLTAGLHEAVRHTAAKTGYTHHGFLNVALAVALARTGGDSLDTARALAIDNPAEVLDAYSALAADWRETFESFGTCSVDEPVASLVHLGLLDRADLGRRLRRPG